MDNVAQNYGLDLHASMIFQEYVDEKPLFDKMKDVVLELLKNIVDENGMYVTAMEARVKKPKSLAGKLELKGFKYSSLSDITDILGARIITFYNDEVDKIASIVEKVFDVDWANSVDKRAMHSLDSFGYNSLHYICRIPKKLYFDPEFPKLNEYRFELQMRTALQHAWSTIHHDTGYKSGVEVPQEYLRNLNRLAGMLELVDEQFCLIRTNINDYRRKVSSLVKSGKFEEVNLDGDTFRNYLEMNPFDSLIKRIASINQAEVHESSLMYYLPVLKFLGFKTLGDLENLRKNYSEAAFQLASYEIGSTDLDIISSTVALQDLLITFLLDQGVGEVALEKMFEMVSGSSSYNAIRAKRLHEIGSQLPFMKMKNDGK